MRIVRVKKDRLIRQIILEHKLYTSNGQMKWWASSHIPIHECVIAYDHTPVGICLCVGPNPKIGVYVKRETRGQGLAKKMMNKLLNRYKDSVRVTVNHNHSRTLFEKMQRKYPNLEIVDDDDFYGIERQMYKSRTLIKSEV